MKPQTARVLRALRDAGEQGVTSNHFRRGGENYIADPPSRVSELRKLGYRIDAVPYRTSSGSSCRRYIFRGSPVIQGAGQPLLGGADDRSSESAPASHRRAGALRDGESHPLGSAPLDSSSDLGYVATSRLTRNFKPPGPDWVIVADYRGGRSRWYYGLPKKGWRDSVRPLTDQLELSEVA